MSLTHQARIGRTVAKVKILGGDASQKNRVKTRIFDRMNRIHRMAKRIFSEFHRNIRDARVSAVIRLIL
jgi:hypothetical protein